MSSIVNKIFTEKITKELVGIQVFNSFVFDGEGIVLIPYEKRNEKFSYDILYKSIIGVEYKHDKVKVIREHIKKLNHPKYITKKQFELRYFIEGI